MPDPHPNPNPNPNPKPNPNPTPNPNPDLNPNTNPNTNLTRYRPMDCKAAGFSFDEAAAAGYRAGSAAWNNGVNIW